MAKEKNPVLPLEDAAKLAAPLAAKDDKRFMAELAMRPHLGNAYLTSLFAKGAVGETDVSECLGVLLEDIGEVQKGGLGGVEATLVAQAQALNAIFVEMARRSVAVMDQHLQPADAFLRLAFKAQAQCRATLQTLADVKNPQSVAFVRQANISAGPQQVNNGPQASVLKSIRANELSGGGNELLPDARAPQAQGRNDPQLEALGAVNGAQDRGWEGRQRGQ